MGGGNIRDQECIWCEENRGRKRCAEPEFQSRRCLSVAERLSARGQGCDGSVGANLEPALYALHSCAQGFIACVLLDDLAVHMR